MPSAQQKPMAKAAGMRRVLRQIAPGRTSNPAQTQPGRGKFGLQLQK